MRWSDINGGYEEYYETEQCKRENAEIKELLNSLVENDLEHLIDYGCGAGLSKKLLTKDCIWTGVEKDWGFKYITGMMYGDASKKIHKYDPDIFVSLFAAEEIGVFNIVRGFLKAPKALLIWYYKPYKDKGSFWYQKRTLWTLKYWIKSRILRLLLNKYYIGTLCNEEGYYVGIKK